MLLGSRAPPVRIDFALIARNGYYNFRDKFSEALLRDGINKLSNAAGLESADGKIDIGGFTKALEQIELAKVPLFVDNIFRYYYAPTLNTPEKTSKIIVSVVYLATARAIEMEMHRAGIRHAVFNGKTKQDNRGGILVDFRKDPTMRVLIMSTATGGIGINLHDTDGRFPRFMFISPSYDLTKVYQASRRAYRAGAPNRLLTYASYMAISSMSDMAISVNVRLKFLR